MARLIGRARPAHNGAAPAPPPGIDLASPQRGPGALTYYWAPWPIVALEGSLDEWRAGVTGGWDAAFGVLRALSGWVSGVDRGRGGRLAVHDGEVIGFGWARPP